MSEKTKNLKILIISAALLIIVLGYIVFTYIAKNDNSSVQVRGFNPNKTSISAGENEDYKATLEVYNEENASKAEGEGRSYVSVLESTKEMPIVEKKVEKKEFPVQEVKTFAKPTVSYVPQQVYGQVKPKDNKYLLAQVEALLTQWNDNSTHQLARTSTDAEQYVTSVTHKQDENVGSSDLTSDSLDKIVDDYAIVPAVLLVELDSDENSVVRAYVPNGKYKGAYLFADGYSLLYESIDFTFTRMVFKGETYNITAKPVDRKTMRTVLGGDVNTRWFERVILPSIAGAFENAGNLYKDANKTILQNGYSQVEATAGLPKAEAIAGVAIGGAASTASKILTQDAAKMPFKQVIVDKNTVIGIQFIGPVLKSDSINYKKEKDQMNNSSINNSMQNVNRYQNMQPIKSQY